MTSNGDKVEKGTALPGGGKKWVYISISGAILLCCCTCGGIGLWILTSDPLAATWYTNVPEQGYLRLGFNRGHTGFYQAQGATHSTRWNREGNVIELEIVGNGAFWNGEKKSRFTYSIAGRTSGSMPEL